MNLQGQKGPHPGGVPRGGPPSIGSQRGNPRLPYTRFADVELLLVEAAQRDSRRRSARPGARLHQIGDEELRRLTTGAGNDAPGFYELTDDMNQPGRWHLRQPGG